jgi:hypothetical protein
VQSGLEAVKAQVATTGKVIRDETYAAGHVLREEASAMAGEKVDQARMGTADALARAARGIEEHAGGAGSPRIRKVASDAAHRLEDASRYVRTTSLTDAATDLRADMGAHPGRWICAALSAGFLTGVCVQKLMSTRRPAGA